MLPIPPGTHWQDAKPAILPGMENVNVVPQLESDAQPRSDAKRSRVKAQKPMMQATKPSSIKLGALRFAPPPPAPGTKAEKPKQPKQKFRNDPKLVEAARELRDRYIEQINAGLLLPPSANGKYDISRQLEAAPSFMEAGAMKIEPVAADRLLDAP